MRTLLPDKVWLLEDQLDAIQSIRKYLTDKKNKILRSDFIVSEVKNWFTEPNAVPDLMLLDICLEAGEEDIVIRRKENFKQMSQLATVSGIKFLTWLRCEWPRLPVVFISSFWPKTQANPNLSQHAVCLVHKPVTPSISSILWIAQQAVIGIYLPEDLREKAQLLIKEVNKKQNHFFFVLCNNEEDLVSPPDNIDAENESEMILLFEAWNNRVLGLIEDEATIENSKDKAAFHPILPFSRHHLKRFPIRVSKEVKDKGEEYLAPYLLRECARSAYLLFFDIKPHPVGTGQCIFDSSTFPPDLIPGILREKGICPECRVQMTPPHAYGGWSSGRDKAAAQILELAREKLKAIIKREMEDY